MKKVVFSFLILLLISSFEINAKTIDELESELAELQSINLIQSQNLARALNQNQSIIDEFQRLHGQIGEHEFFINQFKSKVEASQTKIEILENKITMLTAQLEEIKEVGLLNPDQIKNLDEFKTIENGLTLINTEEYSKAALIFEKFIKEKPKSKFIDTAIFWNAESYFLQADYAKAVGEYQKIIKKYPKSIKVSPSIYKQGLSFFKRQSFDEAKLFFKKVIKEFPQSREANLAKQKVEEIDRLIKIKEKEALENQIS
jgi:tol-pal system protein YbgF